jgi:hypothetical protein
VKVAPPKGIRKAGLKTAQAALFSDSPFFTATLTDLFAALSIMVGLIASLVFPVSSSKIAAKRMIPTNGMATETTGMFILR